jgi:hypothetical protein
MPNGAGEGDHEMSFSTCPDCGGDDPKCFRCDGTGLVCDHCGESETACHCDEEEDDG